MNGSSATPFDTGPLPKPVSRGGILAVVLLYAMFASCWILLSDKLVQMLFSDPNQIMLVSVLKGWFYVGMTSLLLYVLMQRWFGAGAAAKTVAFDSRRLRMSFLALAIVVAVLTGMNIVNTYKHHKAELLSRLQAVADLKARQIADWLKEREDDADFVQNGGFFIEQYRRWQEAGDQQSGKQLQLQLERLRQSRGFDFVMLVNPKGEKLWGSDRSPLVVARPLQAEAQSALAGRKLRRVDPYRDGAGHVCVDFIVPLTAIAESPPAVILHVDFSARLFPMLQNWPLPTVSGEMLLFRHDGDSMRLLNESSPPKAAKLDTAAAAEKLFANRMLKAGASSNRAVEGLDDKGIAVVGVMRAIPGTDWLLVAKLNLSEFYAEIIDELTWVGLVGLLALFITSAGFYLLRQGQQLALVQAVQQSQAERLRALNLLAAISDSSDDPIFAKDRDGCYILFNRASCLCVGKSAAEVLGRDDRDIFPPEQAEMLMVFDRRVIAENRTITQEEVLDTLQGERTFLATKGPLRDSEGNVIGIFGISRDVTERKQAEAKLQARELSYQSLFENMMNSVVHARIIFQGETPIDLEYISTNPAFAVVTGIAEPVVGRRISEVIPGYCKNNPESLEVFGRVAATGVSARWEHYLRELKRWFSFMIYSPNYGEVMIVTENITERKQAEQDLRDSEGRFRALVEQSLAGIYIIQNGRFSYVNPGFAGLFGYDSPETLIGNVPVVELICPEDRERVTKNVRHRNDKAFADRHYSFAGLRRDGSRIDVEAHGRGFCYQGRPAIIGFILNVSERKTAEAQLRVSEERLKLALDATSDGLWDWDLRSGLAYLTPHYYDMAGYRPDQVTPDFEFFKRTVHPDDLAFVLATLDAHLQGKTPSSEVDYRLVTASGEIKWMRGRGRVVERDDKGTPLRMVGTISDISAHKAAEETLRRQSQELAQRNDELERFNRATVGRELDMIALKREVNELAVQLGRERIYSLAFVDDLAMPANRDEGQ